MQESDLFVLASIPHRSGAMADGIPVALMEAMATGVPVITTGLSGIPDSCRRRDRVARTTRPSHALAAAIRRLVEDPDLALRLARAGRHVVAERFSLVSEVDRLAALLAEVANGGASVRGAAA